MSTAERSDPTWVAHEINTILLHLADKLGLQTGPLKSTLKKLAGEWPEQPPTKGCPQNAYLAACTTQAALAALFYPALESPGKKADPKDPKVQLVHAICNDVARENDWDALQKELWASLDKPDLPAGASEQVAAKLEVLESERVLVDVPGGGMTALRPGAEATWPVYYVDPATCRKEADDLVEWLQARLAKI